MSDTATLPEKLRTALNRTRVLPISLRELVAEAADELETFERSFDLRWKADMRAIKRWQAATGRKLTWPDHADLCVWLLEELERVKNGATP
ncbi:hypothetical protein [Bradyrhizobium sp. 150]|uniref:hypothetical protein n=1 Tax=Bradyrhizobium sp. 150 TaxID=2782625 RepID=UPI001FFBBD69|nr:hypothetical protein [Bradyrhizobium sp. 150]MCK1670352.1 hypothetical protein [Bradyrhizobium sp. 150]